MMEIFNSEHKLKEEAGTCAKKITKISLALTVRGRNGQWGVLIIKKCLGCPADVQVVD